MNITIHRDGQNYGPYPLDQVQISLAEGSLLKTDLAWFEGCTEWSTLQDVLNTLSSTQQRIPLPPPASNRIPVDNSQQQKEVIKLGADATIYVCNHFILPVQKAAQDFISFLEPLVQNNFDRANPDKAFLITQSFCVDLFESATFLESLSANYMAKLIIENTLRPEIKNKTYNSLSREISSDAFAQFSSARTKLKNLLDTLGLEYESISTESNFLKYIVGGAVVGGATQYAITRGKNVSKGALAGAILGWAGEDVNRDRRKKEKEDARRLLFAQGVQACITILECIPNLAHQLFDQYIVYSLPERPDSDLLYKSGVQSIKEHVDDDLVTYSRSVILRTYGVPEKLNSFKSNKDNESASGGAGIFGTIILVVVARNGGLSGASATFWVILTIVVTSGLFAYFNSRKKKNEIELRSYLEDLRRSVTSGTKLIPQNPRTGKPDLLV